MTYRISQRRLTMKSRVIAAAVLALIALAALAVACGGGNGDGEEAGIRTRQGLGVAALAAGAGRRAEAADQTGGARRARRPAADMGVSKGGGGFAAPDFYPYPTLQQSQDGITVQGFGPPPSPLTARSWSSTSAARLTGVEPAQRDSSEPGSSGSSSAGGTSADRRLSWRCRRSRSQRPT